MKHFYRFVFLLLVALLHLQGALAQDIHFSQFFETPLLRNPALAGIFTGDVRVQAVFRDQWRSVTDAYKTGSLNGEYKMPVGKGEDFLTLGMQLLYDRAGTVAFTTLQALPTLNFHKSLSNQMNRYLSLGFNAGLVQRTLDRSKMTTNDGYDGLGDGETFQNNQYSYFDGAVGMSFNTQLNANPDNNMYVGLAYNHFNKPKASFYRDPTITVQPKWVASAGVKFSVTEASYLTLQADYSTQANFKETLAGALYGFKLGEDLDKPLYTLHAGAFLRWNDAVIPVVKVDYNPFSFSFSYDVNISKLKTSSMGQGGFEFAVSYIGFLDRERSAIKALHCPRF